MIWVANKESGVVHLEDCEYAMKIIDGRVEYEELYHALSDGFREGGCCLTDFPYSNFQEVSRKKREVRQRVIGKGGCEVCGEVRCVQLAHVVPKTLGGHTVIPLCPTHHKAYDEGLLTEDELKALSHNATIRISAKTGKTIRKMHGAVKRVRKNGGARWVR